MVAKQPDVAPPGEMDDGPPEPVQLDRDAIRSAEDLPMERVDVPEWGGFVYARTLESDERDKFEADSITLGKGEWSYKHTRARIVALSACDERGVRLFEDKDAEWLGHKSAAATDRIFAVARRLTKFTDADIEELAKNSEKGPGDDSPTDSPASCE